jgi:hypothetical protein
MPDACPGHHRGGGAVKHALGYVLCLVALGCGGSQNQQAPINPGQNNRATIDAWLLCHECTDGELESLTALGKLLPAAVESLSTDLLAGPSAARRKFIEKQLLASFTEDSVDELTAGVTPTISSVDYIQVYKGNYVAVYRARAAIALGKIGGTRAGTALDSAIAGQLRPSSDSLRPDVKADVKYAKDQLWAP